MPATRPSRPPCAVHLVTSNAFAGIERHVLSSARAQRAQGWEVLIACPPSAKRLRDEAAASGITVLPAAGGRPGAWLGRLTRQMHRVRPDVLHVHDGRGALAGALLAPATRARFVRTQHFVHTASMARGGWARWASLAVHRQINSRLDGYIAVSRSVADAGRQRNELGTAELAIIPPAIDLPGDEELRHARASRLRQPGPVVAFAGRLEAERQLDVLLRAIPSVRAELPGCRFVLAGSGAAEGELRQLASDLAVDDAITWAGWVPDPYRVLAGAHAYVNTWPREAFGMAMAEAMAFALPIVAVDAGANQELVQPGVTGFLFPEGNADALASALVAQVRDRSVAADMGEAARARALRAFGAAATATSTLELYERLLASRS